jgi:hypothetical protein
MLVVPQLRGHDHKVLVDTRIPVQPSSLAVLLVESIVVDDSTNFLSLLG